MGVDFYIGELLYRYNCVVVPEFGAFLTQMKSAIINKSTHSFYPPSKELSFNQQLSSNDGLLVSYIADAENTTYEETLQKLNKIVKNWKRQLRTEKLLLPNIGELSLSKEGNIQFQPSYQVNYLTSSYGLSSFVSIPVSREVLKEEVVTLEEKIPFIITTEQRERTSFRPYLKYAAILLLAFATGLSGYRLYDQNATSQQIAVEEAQVQVSRNIQEATFFNTTPLELPSLTVKVEKKISGRHHIIAGAFRVSENADKKVRQLKRRGFNASNLGANKYGLHQVSFASFDDATEALEFLRKIKRTESSEAWLLSLK
ncbi:SPOR domain-containing protein [Spongiimicrobium sp. 3-5]|uniref:HU domain-containing protein n=1 Tax=Spongiimicrobium sp. 3-5 TaxID=3332596 RepID=UPI00397FD456